MRRRRDRAAGRHRAAAPAWRARRSGSRGAARTCDARSRTARRESTPRRASCRTRRAPRAASPASDPRRPPGSRPAPCTGARSPARAAARTASAPRHVPDAGAPPRLATPKRLHPAPQLRSSRPPMSLSAPRWPIPCGGRPAFRDRKISGYQVGTLKGSRTPRDGARRAKLAGSPRAYICGVTIQEQSQDAPPPPSGPPAPPSPPLGQVLRAAPMTILIFAACVVVFIAASSTGSTYSIPTLLHFGAVNRHPVWDGQVWRLATSMFLHIGPMHLFWNGWFGFKICAVAEKKIGSWKFLALYLGSGIVGAAASVIGQDKVSAGASGALFGIVGWRLMTLRLQFGS